MVYSVCIRSHYDRVELHVEYMGSNPETLPGCVWLADVDCSPVVFIWSNLSHSGFYSFDVANGYKRYNKLSSLAFLLFKLAPFVTLRAVESPSIFLDKSGEGRRPTLNYHCTVSQV